jgi:hypothetical protein
MSPRVESRAKRTRRQSLIKAGVWVFLLVFVFSIVGVAIAFIKQ